MPFSIHPYRRFPVQCAVTYHAGPFEDKAPSGISRIPADDSQETCPCDEGKKSSRSPSIEQCIEVPGAVVERSRENERRLEPVNLDTHAHARLDNIWQVN
jgi:hypothetical protein